MTPERPAMKRAAAILLALWALLFVGGAVGELFDIGLLRELTDVKTLFLR